MVKRGELVTSMELVDTSKIDFGIQQRVRQRVQNHIHRHNHHHRQPVIGWGAAVAAAAVVAVTRIAAAAGPM